MPAGYQGYVPGIAPENLHGATYGKITEAVIKGRVAKGIDTTPEDRFLSTHMQAYADPGLMPRLNPLAPPAEEELGEDRGVPEEVAEKFWASGEDAGGFFDEQGIKRKQWGETLRGTRKLH